MPEKKSLLDYLSEFVTENRLNQFQKVLSNRTRYITVAMEDIYQPHNASAVLRTCDCFGIQDVHIIENTNKYTLNPDVALGSSKWVSLIKHNTEKNNTLPAIRHLKSQGYRIVATTPHTNDIELEKFDLKKGKTALFFGTEMRGLSDICLNHADEFLQIPMYGFTESFNISVSAAIILHHLSNILRTSAISWQITQQEQEKIKEQWLINSIKRPDLLIKQFNEQNT